MRPQQTLLYDLPGYDANTLFSLLDESGNKVFGVWSQGHIIGHMRKVSGSLRRESTGVMFSLPETIFRFAEEIGINFGDEGVVMKDKKGVQHRFIPIGNHTVEEVDASSKFKTKIKTVSYALGRALSQHFTDFGVGHESAVLSGSQSSQYAVINKVNGHNSIYIGETTAVKRAGKLHQIPHGKGISVSSTQLYQGHYKDGAITGAARSVGIDGSRFRGIFKHSAPTFGEMTLLNGIKPRVRLKRIRRGGR